LQRALVLDVGTDAPWRRQARPQIVDDPDRGDVALLTKRVGENRRVAARSVRHPLLDQDMQRFDVVHAGVEHKDGLSGVVGLSDRAPLRRPQATHLAWTIFEDEALPGRHDDRRGARVDLGR
jgi:hypothetical protein